MISVLLVDDEPDLLDVAKIHLEKSGAFTVDTCLSATAALTLLSGKKYDAIIADYDMPVMNGLELLQELKAQGDATPFIMLTGSGPEHVVMDALNAGACYYLRKGKNLDAPFSDLLHKLHLAVCQQEAGRNLHIFSSISRHDLLNKLAALSGYVELVRTHTDDERILGFMAKQQMLISSIHDQVQFMDDYLNIGVQNPCWQPLAPAIRKAASLLPSDSFTLTLDGVEDFEVFADPLLVKVFYNLIDNSLRHGRHVTVFRVTAEKRDDGLAILCEDDGVGIPLPKKEFIFTKGEGKNSGMGLFLIREILAITGISIRETGAAGEGARFEIHVPKERFRTVP